MSRETRAVKPMEKKQTGTVRLLGPAPGGGVYKTRTIAWPMTEAVEEQLRLQGYTLHRIDEDRREAIFNR